MDEESLGLHDRMTEPFLQWKACKDPEGRTLIDDVKTKSS
jgi:hypothetical protein